MRHPTDFYPTPYSIIHALLNNLNWRDVKAWEPCAGDGRFARSMEQHYKNDVLSHDINDGYDFFDWEVARRPDLITNPPFKCIRDFIDHAFKIGVKRMALVCPERLWSCQKGFEQKQRHNPSRFINLTWREDYLNKGGSPDRALAISIWDRPHSMHTIYEVWSKPPDSQFEV